MKRGLLLALCFSGILNAMYSSESDSCRGSKRRKIKDGEEQVILEPSDQNNMDLIVTPFDLEKDQPLKKERNIGKVKRKLFSDFDNE